MNLIDFRAASHRQQGDRLKYFGHKVAHGAGVWAQGHLDFSMARPCVGNGGADGQYCQRCVVRIGTQQCRTSGREDWNGNGLRSCQQSQRFR